MQQKDGGSMSLWKQMAAEDCDGTVRDVHCNKNGDLIMEGYHEHLNHEGEVYQLSSYFGDLGDGVETNLLIECGANKDLHVLSIEAFTEGFWELEVFEGPENTAAGTAVTAHIGNRFHSTASDATITSSPTLVSTTVDANSGASEAGDEKVLNVTATTNFVVGTWVMIEKDTEHEFAQIASIQAGVSLTMESNMTGSYVNTDTVESCGQRIAHVHTEGGVGPKKSGAGAGTGGEWIFKSGEGYLLRMTNRSGGNGRASNVIWWAESTKQS